MTQLNPDQQLPSRPDREERGRWFTHKALVGKRSTTWGAWKEVKGDKTGVDPRPHSESLFIRLCISALKKGLNPVYQTSSPVHISLSNFIAWPTQGMVPLPPYTQAPSILSSRKFHHAMSRRNGKILNRNEILSLLASLRGQIGMVHLTAYSFKLKLKILRLIQGWFQSRFILGPSKAGHISLRRTFKKGNFLLLWIGRI